MIRSFVQRMARGGLFAAATLISLCAASSALAQVGCSDVEVIFARGSGELPGLGIVGGPVASGIRAKLPGKSVSAYAVNYLADVAQTSAGAGATDTTNHLIQTAQRCPQTQFVLGGYSQGASVMDIALGIPNFLGVGKAIPPELQRRVAAVVLFGNPLALMGGKVTANPTWGSRTKEFCNLGDPVCGAGVNVMAHITYGFDGSADQAATFAAQKINAGGGAGASEDVDQP